MFLCLVLYGTILNFQTLNKMKILNFVLPPTLNHARAQFWGYKISYNLVNNGAITNKKIIHQNVQDC